MPRNDFLQPRHLARIAQKALLRSAVASTGHHGYRGTHFGPLCLSRLRVGAGPETPVLSGSPTYLRLSSSVASAEDFFEISFSQQPPNRKRQESGPKSDDLRPAAPLESTVELSPSTASAEEFFEFVSDQESSKRKRQKKKFKSNDTLLVAPPESTVEVRAYQFVDSESQSDSPPALRVKSIKSSHLPSYTPFEPDPVSFKTGTASQSGPFSGLYDNSIKGSRLSDVPFESGHISLDDAIAARSESPSLSNDDSRIASRILSYTPLDTDRVSFDTEIADPLTRLNGFARRGANFARRYHHVLVAQLRARRESGTFLYARYLETLRAQVDAHPPPSQTLFSHLRNFLIDEDQQDEHTVKETARFILESDWFGERQVAASPSPYEKSLLMDAFRRITQEYFHGTLEDLSDATLPRLIITLYRRSELLNSRDLAAVLVAMAKPVFEAVKDFKLTNFEQSYSFLVQTNTLVSELLRVWGEVFVAYQPAKLKLERWAQLTSVDVDESLLLIDFEQQFMAMIPNWPYGSNTMADRQLLVSSLILLTVITKVHNVSRDLSAQLFYDSEELKDVPRQPVWTRYALSTMPLDESSFIFFMTQAVNLSTINATMLRLSMAKVSLAAEDVDLIVQEIKSFQATSSISMMILEQFLGDKNRAVSLFRTRKYRPMTLLLPVLIKATTVTSVEKIWHTVVELQAKISPDAFANIARTVCEKFWHLNCPRKALQVYRDNPALRSSKRLWTRALEYYSSKGTPLRFEEIWSYSDTESYFASEELWRRRLAVHDGKASVANFISVFHEMHKLSLQSLSESSNPTCATALTIRTGNFVIQRLLQNSAYTEAVSCFMTLLDHPTAKPDKKTYRLLLEYCIENRHEVSRIGSDAAWHWLTKLHQAGHEVLATDCCRVLMGQLTQLVHSSKPKMYRDAFAFIGLTLKVKHGNSSKQSRARSFSLKDEQVLVSTVNPMDQHLHIEMGPHKKELSHQVGNASNNVPIAQTEPDGSNLSTLRELTKAHLSAEIDTYKLYLDGILSHFHDRQRLCFVMVLWDQFLSSFVPRLRYATPKTHWMVQKFRERIKRLVETAPRSHYLALLSGDIFPGARRRRWDPDWEKYPNFTSVRVVWGPEFIHHYLSCCGIEDYTNQLVGVDWRGFRQVTQQTLMNAGVASAVARRRILWELGELADEAEFYYSTRVPAIEAVKYVEVEDKDCSRLLSIDPKEQQTQSSEHREKPILRRGRKNRKRQEGPILKEGLDRVPEKSGELRDSKSYVLRSVPLRLGQRQKWVLANAKNRMIGLREQALESNSPVFKSIVPAADDKEVPILEERSWRPPGRKRRGKLRKRHTAMRSVRLDASEDATTDKT